MFLHFFRHIAIKKPEIYVIENVPGMKKFPVVMEAMSKLPDYYVSVFCPIKTETWLPQKRDRMILIGSKRPYTWQEPKAVRKVSLLEIMEENPTISIPKSVCNRLNGEYRDKPIISDPEKGDIAPTCMAHYAKDRSTRLVVDKNSPLGVRPYTVREWARLQGVPDSFNFAGTDNQVYKQIGNGVPVTIGHWVGNELNRYFGQKKRDICLSFGAGKTHKIRTDKTETLVLEAIETLKKNGTRISKASVARQIGMTREQVSRRYAHLFSQVA